MNALEIIVYSALLVLAGFVAGLMVQKMSIENRCLYENRIELTSGRVLACQYLDGVTRK